MGIPGVLEYPKNESGSGDVDFAPIVFGYSGPSVIVGMGAAISMNDLVAARALNGFVETGGFATAFLGKRAYLFGGLPISDAFLVWVRTLTPQVTLEWQPIFTPFWVWGLHLFSLLLVARIVWGVARDKPKRNKTGIGKTRDD